MAGDLTVERMTLWVVQNRIAMKRSQGIGTIDQSIKRIVLRLDCANGVSGYGEAAPWAVFSDTLEGSCAALVQYLWPQTKGRDLQDWPRIMADCDRALVGHPVAKAALEIALLDARAKAAALPMHQLLGGLTRDRIPLSVSIANPDFEADLVLAKRIYDEGGRLFKIKTGFLDERSDLERVRRFRESLSEDIDLRIDYNQGLQSFGALAKLQAMEVFKPSFIEQPLPAQDWRGMATLSAALSAPILADESVFGPADASRAVSEHLADAFSIKLMKAGGLKKAQAVAQIGEAAGIPCYGGTLWEGPIALTAATQLIAATPNISLGCEFYMPRYVFDAQEMEAQLVYDGGYVCVPEGPGLGLEIDESVLDRTALSKEEF